MALAELLQTISKMYGFEEFTPDIEGVYALQIDTTRLILAPDEKGTSVLMTVPFFGIAPEKRARLSHEALRLNHLFAATKGASFAMDPKTKDLLLQQSIVLPDDVTPFIHTIEAFIEQAEIWKAFFEASFEESPDPARTLSPPEPDEREDDLPRYQWLAV